MEWLKADNEAVNPFNPLPAHVTVLSSVQASGSPDNLTCFQSILMNSDIIRSNSLSLFFFRIFTRSHFISVPLLYVF